MGLSHDERQIEELIRLYGGELVTEHPHRKYRFPDGRKFVMPFSPGDRRGQKNALSDLKRFLGVPREAKKEKSSMSSKIRREVRRVLSERPLCGADPGPLRSLFEEIVTKVKHARHD